MDYVHILDRILRKRKQVDENEIGLQKFIKNIDLVLLDDANAVQKFSHIHFIWSELAAFS